MMFTAGRNVNILTPERIMPEPSLRGILKYDASLHKDEPGGGIVFTLKKGTQIAVFERYGPPHHKQLWRRVATPALVGFVIEDALTIEPKPVPPLEPRPARPPPTPPLPPIGTIPRDPDDDIFLPPFLPNNSIYWFMAGLAVVVMLIAALIWM